jgi:hypothetical protein
LISPVYRCGNLANFARKPAGPGWFLVGDAVSHKDPLFGAGIADAVVTGEAAAGAVHGALSGTTTWETATDAYQQAVAQRLSDRLPGDLATLALEPARPDQPAWIHGLLSHPAFAIELGQRAAQLAAGLPPDRQAFWQLVVDDTATRLDLPTPARITP